MSARLVLVCLAALAIFALVHAETCTTSRTGSLDGELTPLYELISDGQNSITIDLEGDMNLCGSTENTNGLEVRVCVPAGFAAIQFDGNRAVVVSRSDTASSANIEVDFYCRE